MRSLNWKLAGALLLIVAVSVGLMAYLTNLSTTRQFREYVIQGNVMHAQGVGTSLSTFYARQQSWNGVQTILPSMLRVTGDRLIVSDGRGVIVGDTDGSALGGTVEQAGLEGYGTQVVVSGKEVGSYFFLSSSLGMMGMMGGSGMMGGLAAPVVTANAETEFLSRVNQSLWIAGLAALAAALVVGLILTRQITRPVRALTNGVHKISQGDLSYRVQAQSGDEIGELAQSFNTMAANLSASETARRRMTADVAHELRTPLTIIEGTVDGMLDGVFAPDREHLTSIKEQTALLTRLIGDLRDLSLAESGQLKLALAQEDIVGLVRRKLEQVQVTAREKGVQLRLDAPESVPEVAIDRNRVEQVIANLLTNAIRHTPAGGSITVCLKPQPGGVRDKAGVVVSVADTGEGIAPEHLPHIFERFYRVSDSRARSQGGTGLGLAIVAHLVQAHGGRVWAESQPGKGSTFFVFLPLQA